MIKVTFFLLSVLLVAVAVGDAIFVSNGLSGTITAQLINETSAGTKPRIQTMYPESMFDTNGSTMGNMIPYNNPSLGFSLEYPSDWQKDDSQPDAPTLISPPDGSRNMAPEIINIGTEVLPSSNFGLDSYTDAAIGQVQ